jgi:hypothetical protein
MRRARSDYAAHAWLTLGAIGLLAYIDWTGARDLCSIANEMSRTCILGHMAAPWKE